ncbi:MAG: nuclear transport factor 2 family protein [Actinomycetota bacterium]|nr:nuclear transport factor 2 family protein [Actinomycetota bacterium]
MDSVEEIKQLKYRYVRCLDLKLWDEYAACFVPEATAAYSDLTFDDRDSLVDYMRENMGPGLISMHHVHHPEITMGGDGVAVGIWYLEDKVLVPELGFVLEGAAFYDDRYVRTPEGWRISHTGYRRTYEATWSTDDIASFKVKRGTAYDG